VIRSSSNGSLVQAGRHRWTSNRGKHRLRDILEGERDPVHPARQKPLLRQRGSISRGELAEVEPRRERSTDSGNHGRTGVLISLGLNQRIVPESDRLDRKGVSPPRTIQSKDRDAVALRILEIHGTRLSTWRQPRKGAG
jgi:hypothetical protein